jgi:hypothetical protein
MLEDRVPQTYFPAREHGGMRPAYSNKRDRNLVIPIMRKERILLNWLWSDSIDLELIPRKNRKDKD